jgi:hypothetical protein
MTTLAVFQMTVVDATGAPIPSASVRVKLAGTVTDATLKPNRDGSGTKTNPFNADGDGLARFYVAEGRYDVTITSGGNTLSLVNVVLFADVPSGLSTGAADVTYDNGTSGLAATDVQAAIDELAAAGGGGGGTAWQLTFRPFDNEGPATNFATLDQRNGHACLDFDDTTQEAAIFTSVLPDGYGGGGITVKVFCSLTSATSGTVGWDVAIERMDASTLDLDSDSFATAATITATAVPGTSGQLLALSVNIANGSAMDSLAAGEMFRVRVRRDVANDSASGDAELLGVTVVEQ